MTPDIIRAHRHASRHRDELEASNLCGCFYCFATYPPNEIKDWTDYPRDDTKGQTALCPKCGIDSVIGAESGYPLTEDFLLKMARHWFA